MAQRDTLTAAGSAQAAVEALNGVVVHERELRVSPSEPKKERATVPDGTFCSIYVRNLGRAARTFPYVVREAWTHPRSVCRPLLAGA